MKTTKLYFSADSKIRAWQREKIPALREEIREAGGTPRDPEVFEDDAAIYINGLIKQRDDAVAAKAK